MSTDGSPADARPPEELSSYDTVVPEAPPAPLTGLHPCDTTPGLPRVPSTASVPEESLPEVKTAVVRRTPFNARYDLLGELGRGGMGVVFRAFDRQRGQEVALKTLPWLESSALYRFKKEFRTLADVAHPNLVTLHELASEGTNWFFTMELVQGQNFLGYVLRRGLPGGGLRPELLRSPDEFVEAERRLRLALRQLAEAVMALHAAGKLHRDIKPSNVMVSSEERVVLLDFGLAAELDQDGRYLSTHQHVVGTIPYMAPEQASGQPVEPASDWYSVGVMLYEALTGRLPFRGTPAEVLRSKLEMAPMPPWEIARYASRDLGELALALLHREPAERATGKAVLSALSEQGATAGLEAEGSPSVEARPAPGVQRFTTPLIGREPHLQVLRDAFAAVQSGRTVAVSVHGQSGAGKTALVQRFLQELESSGNAVVLPGRCYEQELVPYKAVDSLIDALSRYLGSLWPAEVEALLPRDVQLLARVFPVLRDLGDVNTGRRTVDIPDPQELRRRAFGAMRELLARLGDRRPLVLAIDDLQWGDVDSAALLLDLLRPPDPPVLLFIGSYRDEDVERSPFLRAILKARTKLESRLDERDVPVEPLAAHHAEELARTLLGTLDEGALDETTTRLGQAESIARESRGNPYFVCELARHLQSQDASVRTTLSGESLALDDMLWLRVGRLPGAARRLLEALAVAGHPLAYQDAVVVAELGTEQQAALNLLRAEHFVRVTGGAELEELETYHDRIRETVAARLPPDAIHGWHARIAQALQYMEDTDPELLAVHLQGAGDPRAAACYAQAGERASQALAFDRAARLFRLALDLGKFGDPAVRTLHARLAEALANAGRGAESAAQYLEAAADAEPAESLDLRRHAAQQFLMSGNVDEGFQLLPDVLTGVGLKFPGTARRALAALLYRRFLLRCRGLQFRTRAAGTIDPSELRRIDTCWSISSGLGMIDPIRASYFQTRGLLLALHVGEPFRIARGLSLETAHVSIAGNRAERRIADLISAAQTIADQVQDPYTYAMLSFAKSASRYLSGHWQSSLEACDEADRLLRDHCTGVAWEIDANQMFGLWSLCHMGRAAELSERWPGLLGQARERGARFAMTNLGTYIMSYVRLAKDDPDGARRELVRVMRHWPFAGFHIQHHNALLAHVAIELYSGRGEAAWRYIADHWPEYSRSLLRQIQQTRLAAFQLRAQCALAACQNISTQRGLLDVAERDIRQIRREKTHWGDALAQLIEACLVARRGDTERAILLLTRAAELLDAVDMGIYAAAARRHQGRLQGGDTGRKLIEQSDTWMAAERIRNPGRMAEMLAPGVPQ